MRAVLVVLSLIAGAGACSFRLPPAAQNDNADAPPATDAADAPPTGTEPPFALTGARWLLPCTGGTGDPALCDCASGPHEQQQQIGGATGERWHVTARIRGVMEVMTYRNGAIDGTWYAGGSPTDSNWNFYRLTISAPPQVYYLNPGTSLVHYSPAFDYTQTFDIDAGAQVTFALDGQDGFQWRGIDQTGVVISMTGVTDPAQPFDGQFARIDVTAAVTF